MIILKKEWEDYTVTRQIRVIQKETKIDYNNMKTWLTICGEYEEVDLFTMGNGINEEVYKEVYAIVYGEIFLVS